MSDTLRTRTLPSRTRRLLAGCVDVGVGAVGMLGLVLIGAVAADRWFELEPGLPLLESIAVELNQTRTRTVWEWFLLWLPLLGYEAVLGATERESLGRWLFGLALVGKDGHRLSRTRRVVRALLVLTWPATGLLAPALGWVSPSQRSAADYFAGSWVVFDPAREHAKGTLSQLPPQEGVQSRGKRRP